MTLRPPKSTLRVAFLGTGCVLFIYLLIRLHPAEVFSILQEIGWYFVLIAAIYGLYELVRAFAISRCIAANQRPDYWDLVIIQIAGEAVQFLTFTGPFLAQPAKASLLQGRGLRTSEGFAATVSEFLIYTFTSAIVSIAGLAYLLYGFDLSSPVSLAAWIILWVATGFLAVSTYAIVRRIYLIGSILRTIAAWPVMRKLKINHVEVRRTEDLLLALLRDRPARFVLIAAIELAGQMLLVLELFVLLWAIGKPFSRIDPFLIEASTKFLSVGFFFVPGQMGVTEGAYAIVFHDIGLAASSGFAVAFARRLRSFLIAGAGLAFASVWKHASSTEGVSPRK